MKRLLILLLFAIPVHAQQRSISLPVRAPVYCPPSANGYLASTCGYPYTIAGTTGVVFVRNAPSGFTDSQGNIWTKDVCTGFDVDCFYHTMFTKTGLPGDTLIFPPNEGLNAFLLMYNGTWDFVAGAIGDYANQNSWLGAVNGQGYDANVTFPVEALPGDLIIGGSSSQSICCLLPKAGFGFQIEASNGMMAVEDMIAPVESPYSGTITWKNADGSDGGGGHWLMAVAVYRKRTQ
jgi:hypothetical protein